MRDFGPFIGLMIVYEHLYMYTGVIRQGRIDAALMTADIRLFGVEPTLGIGRFAHPALTDIFAIAYASYFPMPLFLCLVLQLRGRRHDFQELVTAITVAFYTGFLGFLFFPAGPPRFYEPIHAIRLARQLEGYNIEVFEDPVPKGNLDWYVLLRRKMNIAVALHLGAPAQVFEAVKREAVDYLNLSPGNMAEFVRSAHIADAAGVPIWHGSGVDLGITDTSYVHACAAAPNCTLASDIVGNFLREDDLLVEPIRFEDGHALVPQKPGLGVELDEKVIASRPYEDLTKRGQGSGNALDGSPEDV
jgi:hypothetical protein